MSRRKRDAKAAERRGQDKENEVLQRVVKLDKLAEERQTPLPGSEVSQIKTADLVRWTP